MAVNETLNYVEFSSKNIGASKRFFKRVFSWTFTDYGDGYTAFGKEAGLEGGFFSSDKANLCSQGGALLVFYSEDLEGTQQKIMQAGAQITRGIFSFPGGRRFHFMEPGGNEFAVWTDKLVKS